MLGGKTLLWVALLAGCGASDDEQDAPSAAGLTPSQLCEEKCALQVAAGCARTPPDHQQNCSLLCMVKYENFPDCLDAIRPLDACAIERVSWSCSEDLPTPTTMGACAAEAAQCLGCTGDLINCL